MTQKFKEGDIVKIVKRVEQEDGWDNEWISDMDVLIGKYGTVAYISDCGIHVDMGGTDYGFPASSLELIDSDINDLTKDAMRYRWLRDRLAIEDIERLQEDFFGTPDENESVKTDNSVDAAMKGETK